MSEEKTDRTEELLRSWTLPVGEEREMRVEFCGDVLTFRVRILSSADVARMRRAGVRPDGTVDLASQESAINRFIELAIISPKVETEKLNDLLRDFILEALLKEHGYDERITGELTEAIRKKSKRTAHGTRSLNGSES